MDASYEYSNFYSFLLIVGNFLQDITSQHFFENAISKWFSKILKINSMIRFFACFFFMKIIFHPNTYSSYFACETIIIDSTNQFSIERYDKSLSVLHFVLARS